MTRTVAGILLALCAAWACTSSEDEEGRLREAAERWRRAVVEGDAESFLDAQVPEVRDALLVQVRENDERLRRLREQEGAEAVERVLETEIGTDWETWTRLDDAGRFARMFPAFAPGWFASLGLNPEHLRGAAVRQVRVRGDAGEVLFDDGRGHRTLVRFVRTDEGWKYEPPDES